jgi:carboxypeptidase Taq
MVAYVALERRLKRLADLGGAAAVLNWDQAAVMPKGGNAARGEQLAALGGLAHEILTAAETAELIEPPGPSRSMPGRPPTSD